MLLPDDYRGLSLNGPPLYFGIRPAIGVTATARHETATARFNELRDRTEHLGDQAVASFISDWLVWLELMEPRRQIREVNHDRLRAQMKPSKEAVALVPFLRSFGVEFESKALESYLNQRKELGGLRDIEKVAELLLLHESLPSQEFLTYLEETSTTVGGAIPQQLLISLQVEVLLRDNQSERARHLVMENRALLGDVQMRRLASILDQEAGGEQRERLEALYRDTGELIDLRNLVTYLRNVRDYKALVPLLRELFDRERTAESATDLVACLAQPAVAAFDEIVAFFDEHPDVAQENDALRSADAYAKFHVGRHAEARALNDELLRRRTESSDLELDIGLAVSSGEWERLPAIANREWRKREEHQAHTLLRLGGTLGQSGLGTERALKYAALAAAKEPDNPEILAGAWHLYVQLGREDDADPSWLEGAAQLSSPQEGPLRPVRLRDIVEEWIPSRREELNAVTRHLLQAEIPLRVACRRFGESLTRTMLLVPDQNSTVRDGRLRGVLPIVSGGRPDVQIDDGWTVGLDISSVLVLSYLGALDILLAALGHTRLPADIFEELFRERHEAVFHQPSRIKTARAICAYANDGRLRAVERDGVGFQALEEEIGNELATLFHSAKRDNAVVLCDRPIYRAGSLMDEVADTTEYDDLVVSPVAFCERLHQEGRLSAAQYSRVTGSAWARTSATTPMLAGYDTSGPIYADRLTLERLENSRVLGPILAMDVQLRATARALSSLEALSAEALNSELVLERIDATREALRRAIEDGKASLFPRVAEGEEGPDQGAVDMYGLTTILRNAAECDAICIDERFLNKRLGLSVPSGKTVPIVCTLDILRYLRSTDVLGASAYADVRYRLRRGGFSFLAPETDELTLWLRASVSEDGALQECAELKALRQAIAHAVSLEGIPPEETFALLRPYAEAASNAVRAVWDDKGLDDDEAEVQGRVMWDYVWELGGIAPIGSTAEQLSEWRAIFQRVQLARMLLPIAIESEDRRDSYRAWLGDWIQRELLPANRAVVDDATAAVLAGIGADQEHRVIFGTLFLRGLPGVVRREAIRSNPDFAAKCGYRQTRTVSIGSSMRLDVKELVSTADLAFEQGKDQVLRGMDESVVRVTIEGDEIALLWKSEGGGESVLRIPEASVLSRQESVRARAAAEAVAQIGPTAPEVLRSLGEARNRRLRVAEVVSVLDERANGVRSTQGRIRETLGKAERFSVADIVPESLRYFEQFVGPNPETENVDEYLTDVLIPYRKSLLRMELTGGLTICCLGALRDDLAPGQWLEELHDDDVWNAMPDLAWPATPFALIGAVDVALYRMGDSRFAAYATQAIDTLLKPNLGWREQENPYKLLEVLSICIRNRIVNLEDGGRRLGYWRRMAALVHAGFLMPLMRGFAGDELGRLEKWFHGHMTPLGEYAGLLEARIEPMVLADRLTEQTLRNEVLGRLEVMRRRHEADGREVPRADQIDAAVAQAGDEGRGLALLFPGPLEGQRRRTVQVPGPLAQAVRETLAEDMALWQWEWLGQVAQLFALGAQERAAVGEAVVKIAESDRQDGLHDILLQLGTASIIAAAARDVELADRVAGVAVECAARVTLAEETERIVQLLLQSAAAIEHKESWAKWLTTQLTLVARRLPTSRAGLVTFRACLRQMEGVIPTDSPFQIPARAVALAGSD